MEKLVIIDGNSLVNRAFYAMPPLYNFEGINCNAVYGFANILARLFSDTKPEYICVAFDAGRHTFRNDLYAEYKANRKGMPDDLAAQMPILKNMLKSMHITMIEKVGIEADDIIGTLTKKFLGVQKIVVTGDRDSLQLIDTDTTVWLTRKGISDISEMNSQTFREEWGIEPKQIIDLKALMGDSSDNIPGVLGVGEKTAINLITTYQSIDNIYANIENIAGKLKEKLQASKDMCYLSYDLATIRCDAEFDADLESMRTIFPWDNEVFEFFNTYEFRSITKRKELFLESEQKLDVPQSRNVGLTLRDVREVVGKHKNDNVLSISVQDAVLEFAFDLQENFSVELFGISEEMVLSEMKDFFVDEQKTILVFSLKKMYRILDNLGIQAKAKMYDVPLAAYLINSNIKVDDLNHMLDFYDLPHSNYGTGLMKSWFNAKEGLATRNLNSLYYDLELPLVRVLYEMEQNGITVDLGVLAKLEPKYKEEIQKLQNEVCKIAGFEFNLNSPKQLGHVLFDVLGLDDTKNKKHSTNVEVLDALKGKHNIIDAILRYRTISKLNNTYIETMRGYLKGDGKIHTVFNQTGTVTGRLSSNEPNLQNIPVRTEEGKEIRKMFVASKGCELVSADYSQIELRLLAHYSQDEVLIRAYQNGDDIHAITASQIFEVPLSEVTDQMRRSAKAVNFGIIYGISPFGLAQGLGIDAYKARLYIEKYFQTYPTIKQFLDSSVEEYRRTGKVTTLLGRIRNFEKVTGLNAKFSERAAMNMPLQGSASDIIKLAMLGVHRELKKQNLRAKMILQIHDELILDTPVEEVEAVKKLLKNVMENVIKLNVPLVVDIEVGYSWFDV